jgi:hypothetical protein
MEIKQILRSRTSINGSLADSQTKNESGKKNPRIDRLSGGEATGLP